MEAAQTPWPALGALLVRDGAITPAELDLALDEKRLNPKRRLGEILVDQGSATRAQIAAVLAEQHELPFLELGVDNLDAEAIGLLPEPLAKRYGAIPVRILSDGSVLVAVSRSDERDVLRRPAPRPRRARAGRRRTRRRRSSSRSRATTTAR